MDSPWDILKNVLKAMGMFCFGMVLLVAIVGLAAGLGWLMGLPSESQGNGALWGMGLVLALFCARPVIEKTVGYVLFIPTIVWLIVDFWRHLPSPPASRRAKPVRSAKE